MGDRRPYSEQKETSLTTIRELHNEAMDVAFQADRARRRKSKETRDLYGRAFELELEALNRMEPASDKLGWSIMARSAATLAFLAGRLRTAERMACRELANDPHPEIIGELRDLLEAIYFQPDNPEEADAVLAALKGAIDAEVSTGRAGPITYSETYEDVDYKVLRPGFIVGVGDKDKHEGYEVLVMGKYGHGRRVEDVTGEK